MTQTITARCQISELNFYGVIIYDLYTDYKKLFL